MVSDTVVVTWQDLRGLIHTGVAIDLDADDLIVWCNDGKERAVEVKDVTILTVNGRPFIASTGSA